METTNKLGRRKTAIARVYLKKGKGKVVVNGKELKDYFPSALLQFKVNQPLNAIGVADKYDVTINVNGGGINGQAEAIRLGIARALVEIDAECKPKLRKEGFMTRDSRMVERKKPGQKKARKRFQFSKR
ncbi:MAG: 30S ribosomal protein S9 [Bacteroidia bacterium]|nr:30S ribosomal protein S9 [Bacteroidia bacterium]